MKTVFQKGLHVILHLLGAIFFKSKHVGRYFCPYFQGFYEGFHKFCPDFAWIFREFTRIFTKSKLLGVRLYPRLLHHFICFRRL